MHSLSYSIRVLCVNTVRTYVCTCIYVYTSLYICIRMYVRMCDLFQCSITTNYSDGSGMTGLHCAASNGHLRVIQVGMYRYATTYVHTMQWWWNIIILGGVVHFCPLAQSDVAVYFWVQNSRLHRVLGDCCWIALVEYSLSFRFLCPM